MKKKGIAEFDILIIGAGVIGSAIARELSRYELSIAVLEKNLDVCNETSGRNSAVVHGGFAYDTGSLKAKLCVEGNRMMDELSKELDFPFQRCGKVLVGNTEEDRQQLATIMEQGAKNGATGLRLLDEQEFHKLVPAAVGSFAMLSENSGILDPFKYTIALAENAASNGVRFFFGSKVTSIFRENQIYHIIAGNQQFTSRWVINAAGLGCKEISDMLGITGLNVIGSKGNYIILKKSTGSLLPMPVYPVPSNTYMGIHVTNTIDGNVIIGPDAENTNDFLYYGVPQYSMDYLADSASSLWPHINKEDYIRNYSGILPKWIDDDGRIQDFKIEIKDEIAPFAVNLIGIESPGLTAAVPIAKYAVRLMQERESDWQPNNSFSPVRHGIKRFADCSNEEKDRLIKQDPTYGEMICRCEAVTKAELLQSIHNPLGVNTLVGIKYRTRSMMGECQGGFCQAKIFKLIEDELGLAEKDIPYCYPGSWIACGKIREV